jgi:hypothetical protein
MSGEATAPPPQALPSPAHPAEPERRCHDLTTLLDDAQTLLQYASQTGIEVNPAVTKVIESACRKEHLAEDERVDVLGAISVIANKVKPVTAETLKVTKREADYLLWKYFGAASVLGFILLFVSVVSFVATSLAKTITADIATANQFALTLNAANTTQIAALDAATNLIMDAQTLATLQQFAATTRKVYALSKQLDNLVGARPLDENELTAPCKPYSQLCAR